MNLLHDELEPVDVLLLSSVTCFRANLSIWMPGTMLEFIEELVPSEDPRVVGSVTSEGTNDTFSICSPKEGMVVAVPPVAGAGTDDRLLSIGSAANGGNDTVAAGVSAVITCSAESTAEAGPGVAKPPDSGSAGALAASSILAASAALLSISSIRRCTIAGISFT